MEVPISDHPRPAAGRKEGAGYVLSHPWGTPESRSKALGRLLSESGGWCHHRAVAPAGAPALTFRVLTELDLPLLGSWLGQDHVQKWWREPSEPEQVRERYLPSIVGEDPTEIYVIVCDGNDVGLIQRYRVRDYPEWPRMIIRSGLTFPDAVGIDYFIGKRELLGRGIGAAVIRTFAALVFAHLSDVDSIVVTPQAENRASCRVLEKAGFELVWTGMLDSDDPADAGVAAMYVLRRNAR